MQSKARMTIRFEPPAKPKGPTTSIGQPVDPKAKLFAEKKEELANEQVFTTWNSPYQDDIHALEEIIRKSETANGVIPSVQPVRAINPEIEERTITIQAPERFRNDIPYIDDLTEDSWSRGVTNDANEGRHGSGWYNRMETVREDGPSWGRVFLSVAAAVATGALFGYMVLSLFTGEPLFPGKSNAETQLPVQAAPGKTVIPSTDLSASAPPDNSISSEAAPQPGNEASASDAQVAADVYYMLQYGVFQTEESMEAAVKQLQDKGLASASETGDSYRVYVGAAKSRDEAELLAAQMPDIEVYIKPIGGEPLNVSSAELSEAGARFLNASASLTRKLAEYSGIGLQDKQPRKMGTADISALQEAHRQWQGTVSAVDQLNGKAVEDGETIVKALNSASLSMTEFNRKPSRYHLWNVQSAVMKALLADRHLRLMMQPSSEG